MTAVLGIDAAWTEGHLSGVALVEFTGSTWRSVCVAPSYEAFLNLAGGAPVDWLAEPQTGTYPDVKELLAAANRMTGQEVSVITVDMPLAVNGARTRRPADDQISSMFGSQGCSAHSPTVERPGLLSRCLTRQLADAGFPLATTDRTSHQRPCALEVYTHPALLSLMDRDYRVPYKVAKSKKYWPHRTVEERIWALLGEFTEIDLALGAWLGETGLPLPSPEKIEHLSCLKRYEDALDALVCAWIGITYIERQAVAYGDHEAAIWVPRRDAL